MKVAIYARYSTDLQRDASIEDQIRQCREHAEREGWKVFNCYTDHAVSGASLMRPGVQMLMQDAAAGKFDLILSEALDRLSMDQADIATLFKRVQFADVGIVTLSEGEVSSLLIGLKGTMNSLFLKGLADKTRRGLRGRVEKGKSAGGLTYGYDVVKKLDDSGEAVKGEREINESEAAIVRRIFSEYGVGISPKAIAVKLNKEGVPGPSGKAWGASTIYGNRRRGTGILNNELYVGRLVWNRLRYIKDPDTGKRVSRLNPEEEWDITEVLELRIVDQALWDQAKARQKDLDDEPREFWANQRPQNLFSFLLKCGCCGGGFSKISKTHYGCSTARNKGTCDNRRAIHQEKLEDAVLKALQEHLMDPELCAAFCEEYTRHMNELRMEHNASLNAYRREIEKIDRDLDKMIDSILDGVPGVKLKDRMWELENRKKELQDLVEHTDEVPVLIHPNMAARYHREVRNLVTSLNGDEHRTEAATLLRSLIDKIVLTPEKDGDGLAIDLHGDLAGILSVATNKERSLFENDPYVKQDKMVAGAGFEPATFRL